ncbi:hypothetical protein N864_16525 [Intrasporangium chromatireducens Q5-1]|uniref:Uncharacterized protein n=1 Tax=Intrasporangium chromatireducens Q5-1 TaxID=584657 RepID=W9GGU4_9MICO|nr:hypothetical protein [Intrasporangium chromatireducens]EWT04018.1 hypothetical protein N864_16525 [Intrasporangium chromatireducens Q5-1]
MPDTPTAPIIPPTPDLPLAPERTHAPLEESNAPADEPWTTPADPASVLPATTGEPLFPRGHLTGWATP